MHLSTPRSQRRRTTVKAMLACAAWGCAIHPVAAQTARANVDGSGDAWRALSRVGYGPTTRLTQHVVDRPTAQAWALAQIDSAHAASQKAPRIPSELAGIDLHLLAGFALLARALEQIRQAGVDAGQLRRNARRLL